MEGRTHKADQQCRIPKRVLAVGGLFILEGVRGTIPVVQSLLGGAGADGTFTLTLFGWTVNLSLLLLPIGVGILMGKPLARSATRVLCWIFYMILGLMLAGGAAAVIAGRGDAIAMILLSGAFSAPVIAVHRILYSDRADKYFEGRETQE
jgi:hypothetical protein